MPAQQVNGLSAVLTRRATQTLGARRGLAHMTRSRTTRLLTVLFILCAASEGCGGSQVPGAARAPAVGTPPIALPTDLAGATPEVQASFARGSNRFAFDLHRRRPSGNQVFSPGSISLALAMTWAGARGETAQQLAQPFGFDDNTHAGAAGLIHDFNQAGSPLAVANRLYGDQSYDLRAEFVRLAADRYAAPFELVDFRSDYEGARRVINGWVEERTHDRIRDLLPAGSVDSDTRLVLVNAAHFLGTWAEAFERHATRDQDFHSNAANHTAVPMMYAEVEARHATVPGARLLELPYEGGRFSMVFVLPEARFGLAEVERNLDLDAWERWLAGLTPGKAMVSLPRFELKLEPSLSLVEALQDMGVTHAFDGDEADFSGMTQRPAERLVIGDILHQAYLRVDESGTEAAAATAVVVVLESAPLPGELFEFRADQPFLFALRDTRTGLILFLGRITHPG